MTTRRLTDLTWTELEGRSPYVAIPVGSCEQHGPHLPLDTDTRIAEHLAGELAARRDDVVVGPSLSIGTSWEHHGFPGLLSIDADILADLLVETARSADWSAGLVLVNGHGGNLVGLRAAVQRIRAEDRRALLWSPRLPGGDAHAGRTETSMLLAIAPQAVRLPLPEAGHAGPWHDVLTSGVRSISPNGVLGVAAGAMATEGSSLLAEAIDDLVTTFDRWRA